MRFITKLTSGIAAELSAGFVLSKFWKWYAYPLGLPMLTWRHFVALMLAWTFFFGSAPVTKEKSQDDETQDLLAQVLYPWGVLLLGWMVKLCS